MRRRITLCVSDSWNRTPVAASSRTPGEAPLFTANQPSSVQQSDPIPDSPPPLRLLNENLADGILQRVVLRPVQPRLLFPSLAVAGWDGHVLLVQQLLELVEDPDGDPSRLSRIHGPNGETLYFHHVLEAKLVTATKGGRLRWKIENEGFNTQKNSGYALAHAYSTHDHAVKIFYYLLQVAHALNQLMTKGSLLRGFGKLLGSFRNYLRRLAEALRTRIIPPEAWDPIAARSIQIRFDSP